VIFRYLFEGSKGLICFICQYLGDSIHHHLQSILISSWIICLTVDILMGSCFWRNGRSLVFRLDLFSNASLAKASAVMKPALLSFFFHFSLSIEPHIAFLCHHVITSQALSSLTQTHNKLHNCQALSSLTLDHSPSFLSHHSCHSPSRSMSLSFAISLSTLSCLCNSLTP